MKNASNLHLLANAARLARGTDPNDFSGADGFVVTTRRLSDPCYLDLSGPFSNFEAARASVALIRAELIGDGNDPDYFLEVRPIYSDARQPD